MKKLLSIMLCVWFSCAHAQHVVTDYQRIFLPVYTEQAELRVAIRVFKMDNVPSFLVVNPESLITEIMPIQKLLPRAPATPLKPGYFTRWNLASTRYYQLLNKNTAPPFVLENQGLRHIEGRENGNILTIDLCPSRKTFETNFFNQLIARANTLQKPLPITVAISGLWLIDHPQEFQWLLQQEKDKKLAITWANHSFSHVYYADLPYAENFLLTPSTNLRVEFLLTEQYLIEAGEVPSVFFRFPGLVSNQHLIEELKKYGLIPLGADAWLAHHQTITPGGIILVHGNSNEPAGIQTLLPLLTSLHFVDLKEK